MNYINYFIKCCIRNFTRLLFKPKYFFTILIILLVIFCIFKVDSLAVQVPTEYTQIPSQRIDGLVIESNGTINTFGGFYLYYCPVNSGQKIGFEYETSKAAEVRIGYSRNVPSYGGTCTYISKTTLPGAATDSDNTLVAPYNGYFIFCIYPTDAILDVVFYSRETQEDIIQNQTDQIIQNQDKNTEEITNTITSTDYDESVVDIDTSSVSDVDDSSSTQLFTTIFTNFSNLLNNSNWNQVETIQIGLPFVDSSISLRSDILSSMVGDSFFSTLIVISWYSLFGLYCFRFVTHIYHSIKSGDILNGLNLDNEVISSTML